jgi:hypothetical protein
MAKPRKGVVPPQLRKYLFKRKSRSSAARRGVAHMAKRRRSSRVASTYRRVKRRASKSFFGGTRGAPASITEMGLSFGYGYARGWIVNNSMMQSVMGAVPFGGQYKDNVVLGLGAYLVGWLLKPTGLVKEALNTIIRSEAFIAGAKMQGGATLTDSTSSSYAGVLLN